MTGESLSNLTAQRSDGFVADPNEDDYVRAARWALQNKRVQLAVEQAAAAVAIRPQHAPLVQLLDDVIRALRGPLEVLKLPEAGAFYGLCAARARALARAERLDEALEHLFAAAAFDPSKAFVPWGREWIAKPSAAKRVEAARLSLAVMRLLDSVHEKGAWSDADQNLEAALDIVRQVSRHQPEAIALVICQSRILRARGRGDEAVSLLDESAFVRSWEALAERAAISAEQNDLMGQIGWLERARQVRPADSATWLDLANAYCAIGSLPEALSAYAEASKLDPSNQLIALSSRYVGALSSRTTTSFEVAEGASEAVVVAARAFQADLSSYVTRLPDPVDPVAGIVRGALKRAARDGQRAVIRIRVRADRPLAPSAQVALQIGLARLDRQGTLEVETDRGRSASVLWKSGTDIVTPNWPPPSAATLGRVRELARLPFDWLTYTEAAAVAARTSTEPDELISAMAHVPPSPSADDDEVHWVHRFQLACALLLALSAESPERRLERLFELAGDSDDWSAAAAVVALRLLAGTCPNLAPEIVNRASRILPAAADPLAPNARALAVLGCELAGPEVRAEFLALRARVRRELDNP